MYSIVLIVLFFIFSVSCSVIRTDDEEGELVLASVIFRHGARTTYAFYPKDPFINETFYPFGKGQLTNEGKLEEYKLGEYLRELYGEFVGEDYTEEKVYVRSTDVTRTKMSAELVMAGFFPPSEALRWSDELPWLPIPVSYKSAAEEDIFHRSASCSYKSKALNDLPNLPKVRETFIEPFQETYNYIAQYSGLNIKVPDDVQSFYFILKSEADMNYTLPDWTTNIYPNETEVVASYVYAYHNYDLGVKRINSGYMLKKILDDVDNKIKNTNDERKIYFYSGHESTLGYMMDALNIGERKVPPYGCALSFELRRLHDGYYIKLRYRYGSDTTVLQDLAIPGCDVMCPLEDFRTLVSDLLPTMSISEACSTPYKYIL